MQQAGKSRGVYHGSAPAFVGQVGNGSDTAQLDVRNRTVEEARGEGLLTSNIRHGAGVRPRGVPVHVRRRGKTRASDDQRRRTRDGGGVQADRFGAAWPQSWRVCSRRWMCSSCRHCATRCSRCRNFMGHPSLTTPRRFRQRLRGAQRLGAPTRRTRCRSFRRHGACRTG